MAFAPYPEQPIDRDFYYWNADTSEWCTRPLTLDALGQPASPPFSMGGQICQCFWEACADRQGLALCGSNFTLEGTIGLGYPGERLQISDDGKDANGQPCPVWVGDDHFYEVDPYVTDPSQWSFGSRMLANQIIEDFVFLIEGTLLYHNYQNPSGLAGSYFIYHVVEPPSIFDLGAPCVATYRWKTYFAVMGVYQIPYKYGGCSIIPILAALGLLGSMCIGGVAPVRTRRR